MSDNPNFKWKRKGFVDAMRTPELSHMLSGYAAQARDKAQDVSGLKFHIGVDMATPVNFGRPGSLHAWVGATSVDRRTGKPNEGLHKKQAEALKSVGW